MAESEGHIAFYNDLCEGTWWGVNRRSRAHIQLRVLGKSMYELPIHYLDITRQSNSLHSSYTDITNHALGSKKRKLHFVPLFTSDFPLQHKDALPRSRLSACSP